MIRIRTKSVDGMVPDECGLRGESFTYSHTWCLVIVRLGEHVITAYTAPIEIFWEEDSSGRPDSAVSEHIEIRREA